MHSFVLRTVLHFNKEASFWGLSLLLSSSLPSLSVWSVPSAGWPDISTAFTWQFACLGKTAWIPFRLCPSWVTLGGPLTLEPSVSLAVTEDAQSPCHREISWVRSAVATCGIPNMLPGPCVRFHLPTSSLLLSLPWVTGEGDMTVYVTLW